MEVAKTPLALCLATSLACGRSSVAGGGEGASGDDESAEESATNSETSVAAEESTGPPMEFPCEGVEIFSDGFEAGDAAWQLHSRWSVIQDANAFAGGAVLFGDWGDFGVGCPVEADAALTVDLDLSDASAAALEFAQTGAVCHLDTLRVEVLAGGQTTALREPVPTRERWTLHTDDLSPWVGLDRVRITLGFDNVCGDPCGVNWRIDEFRVCVER